MKTKFLAMLSAVLIFTTTASGANGTLHNGSANHNNVLQISQIATPANDDSLKSKMCQATACVTELSAQSGSGQSGCHRTDLSTPIESSFSKWDFSGIKSDNAAADVTFQVDTNGQITLTSVITDNAAFRNLIMTQMPTIKIDTCMFNYLPGVTYNVTLKYVQM